MSLTRCSLRPRKIADGANGALRITRPTLKARNLCVLYVLCVKMDRRIELSDRRSGFTQRTRRTQRSDRTRGPRVPTFGMWKSGNLEKDPGALHGFLASELNRLEDRFPHFLISTFHIPHPDLAATQWMCRRGNAGGANNALGTTRSTIRNVSAFGRSWRVEPTPVAHELAA